MSLDYGDGRWLTPEQRSALRRKGAWKLFTGVGLAVGLVLLLGWVATQVGPQESDLVVLPFGLIRIVGLFVTGSGMADLAEAKGHSRNNGLWVLLFFIGIVVVLCLPDRYNQSRLDRWLEPKSGIDKIMSIGYAPPNAQSGTETAVPVARSEDGTPHKPKRRLPNEVPSAASQQQVQMLETLWQQGTLSDEEYDAARARILGS